MSSGTLGQMLRRLCGRAGPETVRELSDADLLQRFAARRDQAAFEMLMGRHGPMVFGVCRRLLLQEPDAEDAFQATFLVLVRMAGTIGKRGSVAGWLHRVALRLALAVRADSAKRSRGRRLDIEMEQLPNVHADTPACDLRPVLDEELNRLPEKYRLPVILCYLQGKTCEETAAELGCPKGTVTVRLMRAKERLRGRLARRLGLAGGAMLAAFYEQAAFAAPPATVTAAAIDSALQFSSPTTVAAGAFSTRAADLAQGALRAMLYTKIKTTALVALLAALLTAGLFGLAPHLFPNRAAAGGKAAFAQASQKQAAAPRQAPKSDQELILGKWQAVRAVDGGRVVPEDALKGAFMEFTKDKAFFIKSATEKEEMAYQLDPNKSPKWIDITKKGKPQQPAIYELKGETLKIVIDETAQKG
ncbi:MAG: sigma-70 family RNA polymerase sigma factor, partial [Gemmataceae bacterium]|nr:sigma-70 family RNA polymerase sigma factor [Gemmataceae bacterium]